MMVIRKMIFVLTLYYELTLLVQGALLFFITETRLVA